MSKLLNPFQFYKWSNYKTSTSLMLGLIQNYGINLGKIKYCGEL